MKIRYLVLGVALVGSWLLIHPASAAGEIANVTVATDEFVSGNYYAAGNSVDIAGEVESDVFVAGGNVDISGNIGGDVFVAGGNVRLRGQVQGNVRVIGGRVEIAGAVGKNVLAGANALILDSDSQIGGHVTAAAGEVKLGGKIAGSVLVRAGQAVISGRLDGPVNLRLEENGRLEVTDVAVLNDKLVYQAAKPAIISPLAKLAYGARQEQLTPLSPAASGRAWWRWLISLFGGLILVMVVVKLLPRLLSDAADNILSRPGASLALGLIWAIVTPLVCLILFFTLIGIPLALIILAVYLVGFLLAQVFIAGAIANYLRSQPKLTKLSNWSSWRLISLGLLIYYLLTLIPVLGWLVLLLGTLTGWGGMVQFLRQRLAIR